MSKAEKYFKAKEHFHGICPYTNKTCKIWICKFCFIERRERRFTKGK